MKLAWANNGICAFTYWWIQETIASSAAGRRDSPCSQGCHWFESLLPTFSVRSFLQAGLRLMFQKWFCSSEHHILSPCRSEEKKACFLVFNKSKEALSPETPRKSPLNFIQPKWVTCSPLRQSLGLGRGEWALWICLSLSDLIPGTESGVIPTGNGALP